MTLYDEKVKVFRLIEEANPETRATETGILPKQFYHLLY